jgi:hypothetical protein
VRGETVHFSESWVSEIGHSWLCFGASGARHNPSAEPQVQSHISRATNRWVGRALPHFQSNKSLGPAAAWPHFQSHKSLGQPATGPRCRSHKSFGQPRRSHKSVGQPRRRHKSVGQPRQSHGSLAKLARALGQSLESLAISGPCGRSTGPAIIALGQPSHHSWL